MKKVSLWATMLAMLVICALCVTSCGKDDEEEGGGGKSGGKKEEVSKLEDYFDYYYYRCERVGANLVIEMAFDNKSGKDINNALLQLKDNKITDNLGNTYYANAAGATSAYLTNTTDINTIPNYGNNWTTVNVSENGYIVYLIKIYNFDPSSTAKKISFDLVFSSSSLPADSYEVAAHNFVVNDNRVKEKGIQTTFHYLPLHSSDYYKDKHDGRVLANCDKYGDCLVRLPLFYELTDEEVNHIISSIQSFSK